MKVLINRSVCKWIQIVCIITLVFSACQKDQPINQQEMAVVTNNISEGHLRQTKTF